MSHAIALCVVVEGKSKEYTNFKQNLQRVSAGQIRVIDTDGVKKMKGSKYVDKLKGTMKGCHAIVVICSRNFKSYLEGQSKCTNALLGVKEKDALLDGFQEHQRKIILVSITADGQENIPNNLFGLGVPVDGASDIETLADRIKAKMFGN